MNFETTSKTDIYNALLCNASLIKILYKLGYIWGSNPRKATQNGLEMIASVVLKVCKKKSTNVI